MAENDTTNVISTKTEEYVPDKIWNFVPQGGKFGHLNRPTAGALCEKELPRGKHAIQLHSLGTPNGIKVTAFLEELNLVYGIEYDAYLVNIMNGEQFDSGFVAANPNSKIPALLHYRDDDDDKSSPVRVFESGAILMYLAETFDKDHIYLPPMSDYSARAECLSWLFWVQGSAPYYGGGFGHFYNYAPVKIKYAVDRFTMEFKRQLDVLNQHLESRLYLCGDQVTVADFCCWPWYGKVVYGEAASEFVQFDTYTHVIAWSKRMEERESVKRGKRVNVTWGIPEELQMKERHSSSDF